MASQFSQPDLTHAPPLTRRSLRFWWATEIGSERQYFADNPDAPKSIWVNVNQDMVGADQSMHATEHNRKLRNLSRHSAP